MSILSRNVLCILHDKPELIEELCNNYHRYEYDHEYSELGCDSRMKEAFEASACTVHQSLTTEDMDSIENHKDVAYVLLPKILPANSIAQANEARKFILDCFENGARAIKCESSGITHGKSRWIEIAKEEDDSSNYYTWVRRPLDSDGIIYSCGMHLLGLPDIEVLGENVTDSLNLMDIFAMYLLVDKPGDRIQDGHTFSESEDRPKYRLSKTNCSRYEVDDFFYNPNGYWNLQRIT